MTTPLPDNYSQALESLRALCPRVPEATIVAAITQLVAQEVANRWVDAEYKAWKGKDLGDE